MSAEINKNLVASSAWSAPARLTSWTRLTSIKKQQGITAFVIEIFRNIGRCFWNCGRQLYQWIWPSKVDHIERYTHDNGRFDPRAYVSDSSDEENGQEGSFLYPAVPITCRPIGNNLVVCADNCGSTHVIRRHVHFSKQERK